MSTVLVSLAEATIIAEKSREGKKPCVSRRKCYHCFEIWKQNGRKSEEEPPTFHPDFKDSCPMCGRELSHPSIPF